MEVEAGAVVAGGDALAREPSGRVVFVEGALPGELVDVEITETRRDYARGRVRSVLRASPDRVEVACAAARQGCGGCPWLHVDPRAQGRMKAAIVADALRRLAHLAQPPMDAAAAGVSSSAYRTTVRMAVDDGGRAAYHRRRSSDHDLVAPDACLVAHPLVERLITEGRYPGATEVTLRASAATGETLALVAGDHRRVTVPAGAVVTGRRAPGRPPFLRERVAGRLWRISAPSFFQSGPEAAELLARTVDDLIGEVPPTTRLLDAYAGVGLLGGVVAARTGARLTAIERGGPAAHDAKANLRELGARVLAREVAGAPLPDAEVGIADPARPGLGKSAAAALAATGMARLVLVSCDPASLARDATLLGRHGFVLDHVVVLDLFPGTPHVEAVSRFVR